MKLQQLVETNRTIRVLGVDDAHYADKTPGGPVCFSGIICGGTRFEGMIWGQLTKDGFDSTDMILQSLQDSKFKAQLHLVILDGITFGGCNVVDVQRLSSQLQLPVVAVMRRMPDLKAFGHVVKKLPEPERRQKIVDAAGSIHESGRWYFQVAGEHPDVIPNVLDRITDQGNVPEALRLAHLIGSAVMMGESSNRA